MESLISIIVPVYNVEEYLDRCVESIINQTYTNLEIILVDDGSPDNCPAMCDAWAEKDSRIKVVHKENGGLSDARNVAIDTAKGDYILFVDSDDYITYDCADILLKELLENKCDMVVARYVEIRNGVTKESVFSQKTLIFNEVDYWKHYYINRFSQRSISAALIDACHKLYKKELFKDVRFPVGRINEDTFTTYKIVSKCNRIAYVDKPLYYYIIRADSLSHDVSNIKQMSMYFDIIDAMKERVDYFVSSNMDDDLIRYAYIDLLNNQIERCFIAKYDYKNHELYLNIKKDYKSTYRNAKSYKAFSSQLYKNRNILFHLFYINEYLFKIVRKIKTITGNL